MPHSVGVRPTTSPRTRTSWRDSSIRSSPSPNDAGASPALSASVPLALDQAVRDGRIQRGQTLLLEGVGGGFTWGAVLVDY